MKNRLALKLQALKLLISVTVPICTIVSCLLLIVNNIGSASASASEPLKPLQPFEQRELQQSSVPRLSFPEESGTLMPKMPPPKTRLKAEEPIVRGQAVPTMNEIDEILKTPPPHVQGTVDVTAMEPKLVEQADVLPLVPETAEALLPSAAGTISVAPAVSPQATAPANGLQGNQFAYGTLLLATAVTTIGLVYMAFVAYDYRQRWMQTLLTQNERFSLSSLDSDFDDMYGAPHYV
jgi:hypothetical protein